MNISYPVSRCGHVGCTLVLCELINNISRFIVAHGGGVVVGVLSPRDLVKDHVVGQVVQVSPREHTLLVR